MERKKLTDILRDGNGSNIRDLWDRTEAAGELSPLPPGEYIAHAISGELCRSKEKGTPSYKLTFRVCEGEHVGRQFWHDCWLTPLALPQSKRDLAKLCITSLEQLERPLPPGICCKAKVVVNRANDGTEYNKVKRFDFLRIDTPAADAFAPVADHQDIAAGGERGEGIDQAAATASDGAPF